MESRSKALLISSFVVILCGCATTDLPATSQNYNAHDSARIRLFGQNGRPSIMVVQAGQGANIKPIEVNVGGGFGDAFGSMLSMVKNKSIGMPKTENTRNLASRNGLLSKAFYREFVIPANKVVRVRNAFIGLPAISQGTDITTIYQPRNCTSGTISFIPEAGKDYEVVSYNKTGSLCSVVVFDIQTIGGKTILTPVQAQ